MERRLIECVPNFSEGRDKRIINAIADAISGVEGVRLLNVDPGEAANRTVYTYIGEPEAAMEASFRAIKKASDLIDMRKHKGEHPRIGAADVFPIVPVSGVTLEEADEYAKSLAARVERELNIPIYLYEFSASHPDRRKLSLCRSGEYEGLKEKMSDPRWVPDYGCKLYNDDVARTGAIVMGARNFLVAINFNLDTKDTEKAWQIARNIREIGHTPYSLKGVRAIGWYIEEYGVAQVSMNITDITAVSLQEVWDGVNELARKFGVNVTGTELIGLIPEHVLIEAAEKWGLKDATDKEKADYTIETMNFSDLGQFDSSKKILDRYL